MKKTLLIIILAIYFNISYSSNDTVPNYKNQVRFSIGTHIRLANISSEADISYLSDNAQFGLPSLTYIKYASKNDYHEISLNDIYLKIGNFNTTNSTNQFGVGLSYNYNVSFIRKKVAKIQPYIGFGSLLRYDRMNFIAFITSEYPFRKNNISLQVLCTPRINFNIKKHWCVDLSIPFDLASVNTSIAHINNPSLPLSARKTSKTYYSYFPTNMNIRVGVGYKF